MGMLSKEDVSALGLHMVGRHVRISDRASIYGCTRISIGAYSRIDDFCVLSAGSGGIRIGRHVHIGAGCMVIGEAEIVLDDFSGLSGRVSIYSSSDDYSGLNLTNPTVPLKYRNVTSKSVKLCPHVIIGAGSVILPGVTLGLGSAVGALTLVRSDVAPGAIVAGTPARRIGDRSPYLFELERALANDCAT